MAGDLEGDRERLEGVLGVGEQTAEAVLERGLQFGTESMNILTTNDH